MTVESVRLVGGWVGWLVGGLVGWLVGWWVGHPTLALRFKTTIFEFELISGGVELARGTDFVSRSSCAEVRDEQTIVCW